MPMSDIRHVRPEVQVAEKKLLLPVHNARKRAAGFASSYALFALVWIFASDYAAFLIGDSTPLIQGVKGSLFVFVTAVLLHVLLEKSFAHQCQIHAEAGRQTLRAQRAIEAFSMVTGIDTLIMSANSVKEIYTKTCERLAESDNYCLAWVGIPQNNPTKSVDIVACAGEEVAYLQGLEVGWGYGPTGKGMTAKAVSTEKICVLNNALHEESYKPWAAKASLHRLHSSIAVPIIVSGKVAAVLRVYSHLNTGFHVLEKQVFSILADHIAYALQSVDGVSQVKQAVEQREELEQQMGGVMLGTVMALARAIDKRDPYTAGHQQSVATISMALGRKIGLSKERLQMLELGALIHDIGKLAVPADILTKPSALSSAEFAIIQEHCQAGYDILSELEYEPIKRIVVEHHERLDGSGYPKGLTKDRILLESRIVAVADVVDSITSHRPYRPALGLEKARDILHEGNGHHFDPDVIKAFDELYTEGFEFPGTARKAS